MIGLHGDRTAGEVLLPYMDNIIPPSQKVRVGLNTNSKGAELFYDNTKYKMSLQWKLKPSNSKYYQGADDNSIWFKVKFRVNFFD